MSPQAFPVSDGVDDAALVAGARRGELRAQEALFRKHAAMVNNLCFRLLGSHEDLDDLVQDSFLQAFRSLAKLDQPETFRAWLAQIVIRTTHKLIRRRRLLTRFGLRTSQPLDLEALISPACPPDVAMELTASYQTLQSLPARLQVALVLRRIEGRTLEDVALLMGASLASVKRWVKAADRALVRVAGGGKS